MIRILRLSILLFIFLPHISLAQIGVGSGASIESSPRFPEPGETVTLALDIYSLTSAPTNITWLLDGQEQPQFNNQRSVTTVAKELGEITEIEAVVQLSSGSPISISHKLVPSQIDIIIEADTTVPTFYRGRPLPSIGSTVRAIALVSTGTNLDRDSLSYTWRLNNQVLGGGSQFGKHTQSFTMPMGREVLLQVDVASLTGEIIASESVVVPNVEPEIYFYPNNPLRGLSAVATGDEYRLLAEEIDIRAEPYYVDTDLLNGDSLVEWKINNQTVENPSRDPQVITLQNAGGSGRFSIGFHIRNLTQLLQGIEDSFVITF